MTSRVLDVGQCAMDHGAISRLITKSFGAQVDRAHTLAEALDAVGSRSYDLVLVNRILDTDGSAGMAVLEAIKQNPRTAAVRVMLVSNYADAQAQAVAAGAEPGFGKNSLNSAATRELLQNLLSPRDS